MTYCKRIWQSDVRLITIEPAFWLEFIDVVAKHLFVIMKCPPIHSHFCLETFDAKSVSAHPDELICRESKG